MAEPPILRRYISEFIPMPKIPRLHSPVIVTEKLDGTNACVEFYSDGEGRFAMGACSRNRRLVELHWDHEQSPEIRTLGVDNYGFGAWVAKNYLALRSLGYGRHFGEWWGAGIARRYDQAEKRFSLFKPRQLAPCLLELNVANVPIILEDETDTSIYHAAHSALELLRAQGSYASPGFMQPEGVVAYHERSGQVFKLTFEAGPKGKQEK